MIQQSVIATIEAFNEPIAIPIILLIDFIPFASKNIWRKRVIALVAKSVVKKIIVNARKVINLQSIGK